MVLLVAFVLWMTPMLAQATTYYVATTGSDSANGAEATPFASVAKCTSTMVAGDTCYVRGGSYSSGVIRFGRTGTQAEPIVLSAYPGELPVVNFQSYANLDRILIQNSGGANRAMGWITIQGLELVGGHDGIKYQNLHDSIIRNNHIHDAGAMGILGIGGTRVLFERNIIHHNGRFAACDAGTTTLCFHDHGIYAHGSSYTIRHNIFYWHQGFGVQQNGSSTSVYSASVHAGPEFAGAANWIVDHNTFAYSRSASGYVVWGSLCTGTRIENNVFYENAVTNGSYANGINFTGTSTGLKIRNNHFYASGSGGTAKYSGSAAPGDIVDTGNVVNVSAPAFVNGGSNALPASPDFRLTARAPLDFALANEFPSNGIVGAFEPPDTPTVATISTNKITVTLPMSTATPVQNLSATGVSFVCTTNVCPGSPAVSSVSRAAGTDSQPEITLSGITSNACVSHADAVTVSYSASTGSWTGNDNVGPAPGLHQKILSFSSLSVVNQCDGSAATGYPSGYQLYIPFSEGTGTVANDSSANSLDCTFTNSPTWGSGKTGYGMVVAASSTQHCALAWGSGVNPSTQSLTIFVPVYVTAGSESVTHYVVGPDHGTNQRFYVCGKDGTWRIAVQATTCSATAVSNLAVKAGWNLLTIIADSSTDIATLYEGTVAGTGGATAAYTSFTFASNFTLGKVASLASTGGTYDDLLVYLSIQSVAELVDAFNGVIPTPTSGTLTQAAIQFQGVILDTSGSPIVIGPSVQTIEVPAGGGAVILFQVHCTNVADCELTAFKFVYAKNGSSTWVQVPDVETTDGTWMWGVTTEAHLNNGIRSTRLTGSCAVTNGATQLTSAQTPSVDLPQDGCVVVGYIARVGASHAGDYFDYKLQTEAGLDLPGGYTQTARIRVVNPMASGIGF